MAQPTVRIHPPKRGDEEWLASMIAPLLDHSSDLLVQGFAMGPISVGEGLNPEEADDLVDVLKGFGARAERIDGQPRTAPRRAPAAPLPSQTQPFDGGHLRRMLAASPPVAHAPQRAARAPAVKPPVRRSAPVKPPAQRNSSPLASPSARPSAGPPPRVSGAVTTGRGASPSTRPGTPATPAPPGRSASATPSVSPAAAADQPGRRARSRASIAAGSPSVTGRPARASKGPTNAKPADRSSVSGDVPPWFPQVPMRPGEDPEPERTRNLSWLWFVLIMTLAGAAAWYLQTRID